VKYFRETGALAAAILLAAGSSGCRREAQPASTANAVIGVAVATAHTGALRDVVSAPGTIVPSASSDWSVVSGEPAQVAELPKKEGDAVHTGDLLVRFDVPAVAQQLAAHELSVSEASARLDRAKAESARLENLFAQGLMARNTFENSKSAVGSAETALSQAQAELQLVQLEAERTSVRARFPGVVLKVWHAVGDSVSGLQNDPVLRVVDPSHLQATLQLPIGELARVNPGQIATVRALADSVDRPATVAEKRGVTDAGAPTGEVRVAFMQPPDLPLDSPVSVEIVLDQRSDALIVPLAAIQRHDTGELSVMVVGDDRRAHQRAVRVGLVTRDAAEIVSGLTAGERVIVSSLDGISDGTEVAVGDKQEK
jgi:RND family efflux transporter MFP subunit